MTEAEWLTATDPYPLQVFLAERHRGDERRWRLFAAACCRHVLAYGDGSLSSLLVVFERFADGLMDEHAFVGLQMAAVRTRPRPPAGPAECVWSAIRGEAVPLTRASAYSSAVYSGDAALGAVLPEALAEAVTVEEIARHSEGVRHFEEQRYQAGLLRDIFGNPFRPAAFDRRWRTADVIHLARAIYDERAFDRLPILADALQNARCESEDILTHCLPGRGATRPGLLGHRAGEGTACVAAQTAAGSDLKSNLTGPRPASYFVRPRRAGIQVWRSEPGARRRGRAASIDPNPGSPTPVGTPTRVPPPGRGPPSPSI